MAQARNIRSDLELAACLVIIIVVIHIGTPLVAKHFGVDWAWLFYIMRGIGGAFVFGLFLRVSPYVAAAALWGLIEEGMTSVCGAITWAYPVQPKAVEGLCDAQLGFPLFHWLGLLMASLLALSIAVRDYRRRNV